MMRLLQPDQLVWAFAALGVGLAWVVRLSYTSRQRRRWPVRGGGQRRTGWLRDTASLALGCLAVLLLAGALSRPQRPSERQTATYEKQDLVLILDRSVSMRARDIEPSRFMRAVDEIRAFLDHKPVTLDRVALVGFAATSVVLSYPTSDLGSLYFYLAWVREDPATLYGTDMGAAIETALAVAAREGTPGLPPIFVLISDGEDQGTALERAIAGVRRGGIRLYTIGVGSNDSVPIPIRDDSGREDLLRTDEGDIVRTRFEERTLRRLASVTGGQYFRSSGGGELYRALGSVLDEERRVTGSVTQVEHRDLHPWLLAAAAVTLLGLVALW
jgi:Ca-activated chloride channel family protein